MISNSIDARSSSTLAGSHRNTRLMIDKALPQLDLAHQSEVMGLSARPLSARRLSIDIAGLHRCLVDFVRCSYLGLDNHPEIIEGAIEAIKDHRALHWSCARTRMSFASLTLLESDLADLFQARVITYSSVLAANMGALPLLASGHLTAGNKPVLVFDRFAHATLAFHKATLAAETTVVTIDHNDISMLEQICKQNPVAAYICDGVYSMGGAAPVDGLLSLQQKYGLFLYIDDAHGISLFGRQGDGFVRSQIAGDLGERTIIAASLGKGFGASGGLLMLGSQQQEKLFRRFAIAHAFSASLNLAAVGAARASARLHRTAELLRRQISLQERIKGFDRLIKTDQQGSPLPIRTIRIGNEASAISAARALVDRGFFTSAIFFPTVPEGQAGLRLCLTAGHTPEEIEGLCNALHDIVPLCEGH
ncbi:aminotransferase class I/II-fold pyridoxal phosphate-dependent enzyme [Rhizobium terrae]|uniref:aminotransferase class I/II-fold pyridoxal phosphate-dependent enzyme n=1 Tax=Rhizobium terrae TaxID=2171756 RepID=UPI000E3DE046|nr:aminotransferase class I/II-fold pyridoxal phosphate-dependent enzyme [Rhizobium terrae]